MNLKNNRAQRCCCTAAACLILLAGTGCRSSGTVTTVPSETIPSSAAATTTAAATTGTAGGSTTTSPPADSVSRSDAASGLEALYWARRDSGRTRFTEADVQFMTGMITHHAQALIMSALAPTHAAGTQVQTLTSRIINAQKDEIATMQQWLRDRGQPVPEVELDGLTLKIHGVDQPMTPMPGMLSQQQLGELNEARGRDFDRLFLTYMIQHHRGAVTMVNKLFSTDGAGQDALAFKLASDINADQKTEIARMQRMLRRMSAAKKNP